MDGGGQVTAGKRKNDHFYEIVESFKNALSRKEKTKKIKINLRKCKIGSNTRVKTVP